MGAALRNLSSTLKALKQSVSGKGKLTQEKITKIQNYYGRAIKDNAGNIEMMKKRILPFCSIFLLQMKLQNICIVHQVKSCGVFGKGQLHKRNLQDHTRTMILYLQM